MRTTAIKTCVWSGVWLRNKHKSNVHLIILHFLPYRRSSKLLCLKGVLCNTLLECLKISGVSKYTSVGVRNNKSIKWEMLNSRVPLLEVFIVFNNINSQSRFSMGQYKNRSIYRVPSSHLWWPAVSWIYDRKKALTRWYLPALNLRNMNKNNPPSLSVFHPVVFTIGNRKQTTTCGASGIVCCYTQPQESQSNKRK